MIFAYCLCTSAWFYIKLHSANAFALSPILAPSSALLAVCILIA